MVMRRRLNKLEEKIKKEIDNVEEEYDRGRERSIFCDGKHCCVYGVSKRRVLSLQRCSSRLQ